MGKHRRLLERAARLAGSQRKLARACGVSQTAIHLALKRDRVSAELAQRIHVATGGAVARWELRPDLFEAEAVPA